MQPEPSTELSPAKAALLERLRAGQAGAGEAPLLAPEPGGAFRSRGDRSRSGWRAR